MIMRLYTLLYNKSPSLNPLRFIFSFLFFNVFLTTMTDALTKLPECEKIPAVIVFGDSVVDSGNNNYIVTPLKCDFPPYGIDFDGGKPTGRFCDGKVPSDFIVEGLGIKETVPAYLKPNLNPEELLTGVNFASGGSGYDPMTPTLVSAISLSDQLKYFEDYIRKLKEMVGSERTNFILEKSLFLVFAGSNDLANTYNFFHARPKYDIGSYTTLMADHAIQFAIKLYGYGARRIGVSGVGPIGCVPFYRTLKGGLERKCADNFNEAASLFNVKLYTHLDSLTATLNGSRFVYIDYFNLSADIGINSQKYGFEVIDKGCCGTGLLETSWLCNKLTAPLCPNVSAYLFWDGYHPTERCNRILASHILDQYLNKFF